MLRAQQAYGQEDARCDRAGISLGRRIYRLVPEDRFDRGPAIGGDGSLVLCADARIDNREEVARALGLSPADVARLADSALLLRALEGWPEQEALDRVVGDFAFALWDRRSETLRLVRDFAGQRPLHFHRGRGFFAFATMPKGLHALPELPRAPDAETMAEFLALLPEAGRRTFFEGVERVEPGHVLIVTRDGVASRRWWNPRPRPLKLDGPDAYAEALREQLDTAVGARLRGTEKRVAAHLSGGFDSAAVAATAARLLRSSGGEVVAFTAVPRPGFTGKAPGARIADEGPLAAETAALHPNIEHVRIDTAGRTPLDSLDPAFFLYERPVLNICNAVWTNAINEAAKRAGLIVLLAGHMGNISLSYAGLELLPELLARGRWIRLAREAIALRRGGMRPLKIAMLTAGPYLPLPLWRRLSRLRRGGGLLLSRYSAVTAEAVQRYRLEEKALERNLDFAYRPWRDAAAIRLWTLLRVDPGPYRKGQLAGWGIDVRDPTADRRLIEFSLSVPAEQFLRGGTPRALAIRAFADRLPAAVLSERRTGEQAADWYEGLATARGGLEAELRSMAAMEEAGEAIDAQRLDRLVSEWPESGWEGSEQAQEYRLALLRGVSAAHFLRKSKGANV
jgi:asparagine synthase (glutamine-hydrolysing)